jgi:DNA-binding transcriptional LysR family regulator
VQAVLGDAIEKTEHGVQPLHTASDARTVQLDPGHWADLRFLMAVAQGGSLRAAADSEKVAVNTVRAGIERLEQVLGLVLLRRDRNGSALTEAGIEVLRMADEMRMAARGSSRECAGNVLVAPGELRIACSEGLGLLWLTPRLVELSEVLPRLTVNLALDYDLSKDRSTGADILLTFARPTDPDLIMTRLATLHYMMFASESYLRVNGTPQSLDEIRDHPMVEQVTPGVKSWLLDHVIGSDRPAQGVRIRTNSSLSQLWAVANGAGIAPMPTFVRAITRSVVPIDPPLNLRFDLFCTYHSSARGSPAIEAGLGWLRHVFDGAAQPWFRSEFVHPLDFPRPDKSGRVVSLFDNLIDPVVPARAAG